MVHSLVAERLESIELEVYSEEVLCWAVDVVAVLEEHLLEHVELRVHLEKVMDHLLRLLEVSVYHGYLGVAQELSASFGDVHAQHALC